MAIGIGEALATASTIGSLLEKAKKRFGKSLDSQAAEALLKAIELTSELQSRLAEAEREILRLEADNLRLRAEQAEATAQAARVSEYEEQQIGQAVVLVRRDQPGSYYCPNCAQTKKAFIPLQAHPIPTGTFGSHYCSSCETSFRL